MGEARIIFLSTIMVGMHCPFCGSEELKITNSRPHEMGVRRRRECLKCGKRFTTLEVVENKAFGVSLGSTVSLDKAIANAFAEKEVNEIVLKRIAKACDNDFGAIYGILKDIQFLCQGIAKAKLNESQAAINNKVDKAVKAVLLYHGWKYYYKFMVEKSGSKKDFGDATTHTKELLPYLKELEKQASKKRMPKGKK